MPGIKGVPSWNSGKIEWRNCLICQKTIRKWQKYCSPECYQANRPVPILLDKTCITCNKKFQVRLSKKNSNNCSIICAAKKSGKTKSGKNHPLWRTHLSQEHKKIISESHKGKRPWNYRGVTSQNKLERSKFRKEIQKLVFERDNYTCQMCNKFGGILHVDHIQPWAEYVELRFNMNNLRTLCRECHYLVTFGKKIPETSNWGKTFMKGGNSYVR